MSDSYHYSSPFRSAEYRLTNEGVALTTRKFGRVTRTSVPFDQIPVHSSTATWSSKPLLWAAVILAVCFVVVVVDQFFDAHPEPAALVLYGVLCAIFAAAYYVTRTTSEVFMFGDGHLSIFRPTSDDERLTSFVQALQQRKLDFFKQRVARRASEVPSDEVARYLIYLRESNLVDEAGYATLRSCLDDYLYAKRPPIGFQEGT